MSRTTRVSISALVSTVLLAFAGAAPAVADTTIGQTGGNQTCTGGFVAAATNYVVPAGGGVITNFSYGDDGHNAGAQLDFEVLRPNPDGSYTILAHTGLKTLTGVNGVETFAADIPVSGGEIIGYYETGTDNCLKSGPVYNVVAEQFASDPGPGTTLAAGSVSSSQYSLNESATVGSGPAPVIATGGTVSGSEGTQLAGDVATFSDSDNQPVGSYSATITWGDGATSSGTVTQTGPSQYAVNGSHTYAEEGSYVVGVQITDTDGGGASPQGAATVADADLSATGVGSSGAAVATQPSFSGPLATLSDQNLAASAKDFTASIDWGDGTTSTGAVAGGGGSYTVSGSHTYAADGPQVVKVTVADAGGSQAETTSYLLVYENASQNGSFVIGDRVAGPQVFFWGAGWALHNPLSGGRPPWLFMGFAGSGGQSCGAKFVGRLGRNLGRLTRHVGHRPGAVQLSSPPATVPAYMAVAVTGHLSRAGLWVSGTVERLVVVKTDPGYGPSPASPGTGQIVATLCGGAA